MAKISRQPKLHPNGQLCIQHYPSTGMCGDGMEKSIGSPRMRVFSFKAAGAVVGDAEAILVKRASVLTLT